MNQTCTITENKHCWWVTLQQASSTAEVCSLQAAAGCTGVYLSYALPRGQITSNRALQCDWRKQPFVCSLPYKGLNLNHARLPEAQQCHQGQFLFHSGYLQRKISAEFVHAGLCVCSCLQTEWAGSSTRSHPITHHHPFCWNWWKGKHAWALLW